jgi:hypothetical protein
MREKKHNKNLAARNVGIISPATLLVAHPASPGSSLLRVNAKSMVAWEALGGTKNWK